MKEPSRIKITVSGENILSHMVIGFKCRELIDIYGVKFMAEDLSYEGVNGGYLAEIEGVEVITLASTWTGEGLPPVGEIIEWLDGEFLKAAVVGHHQGAVVAVDDDDPRRVFIGKKPCYRPIRTPEQIAAEEREMAVDEMVTVWKRTMGRFAQEERGLAEMLYDAGYRKQEQTK